MARVAGHACRQTAKRGEVIEIKTLVAHAMETGFRRTQTGELIPRDIITQFVCTYNGVEIFRAELHPAIAANPLHRLHHRRDRERHAGVQVDRRQRLHRHASTREHHRRLRVALALVLLACSSALACAGGDPARRAPLRLRVHEPRDARHAGRRRRPTRRCFWLLDGEALWEDASRRRGLPRELHELKGVAARYPALIRAAAKRAARQPRAAHQRLPRRAAEGAAARLREPASCSRSPPTSAASRAACRSTSRSTRRNQPFLDARHGRIFKRRQGQLNLACAQCHDDNWGKQPRRHADPAGASDRLSDLPPRVAGHGLAAAAAAQLHDRRARRAVRVRRAGVRRAGVLPDVARARDEARDPRSPALSSAACRIVSRLGGIAMPFSLMMPVMSSAGVTSKAGLRTSTPSGAQRAPR